MDRSTKSRSASAMTKSARSKLRNSQRVEYTSGFNKNDRGGLAELNYTGRNSVGLNFSISKSGLEDFENKDSNE